MNLSSSLPKNFPKVIIDIILSYYDFFKGDMNVSLVGHSEPITCIDVVSKECIVSGSLDKTVRVWNVKTAKLAKKCDLSSLTVLKHKHIVTCVAVFSVNNTSHETKYIVSGLGNGKIIIWDMVTGKYIRTLKGHTDSIKCISFIHANSRFENKIVSASNDGTFRIWSFEHYQCESLFQTNTDFLRLVLVDDRCINNLIVYQNVNDGYVIIITFGKIGVYFWKYDCGYSRWIRTLTLNLPCPKYVGILSKKSSPKLVMLYSFILYIRDLITEKQYRHYNMNCVGVACATILPNDLIAIGLCDGTLVLWDADNDIKRTIGKHSEEIQSVFVLSENHGIIASRSKDGILKIWNVDMNGFYKNNSDICSCIHTFMKNEIITDTSNFLSKYDNTLVTYCKQNIQDNMNEIIVWK